MQEVNPVLRIHPWFEVENGVVFGLGRMILLKNVQELGSLNKAAREMGMSYRAAWGKIKATEEALGTSLLHRSQGRKGFCLTSEAEEIMRGFETWYAEVEDFAYKRAGDIFPWRTEKFGRCALGSED